MKPIDKKPPVTAAKASATPTIIKRSMGEPDTSGRYLYYPGAKETILDVVLHLVPHNTRRLIEPFTGSGALASGLAFRFHTIEASDLNAELIESHRLATTDTDQFLSTLQGLFGANESTEKAYYEEIKDKFNDPASTLADKAAYLVFMNRKGFKGLMRRNKRKGEFNTPFWKERANAPIPDKQVREFADRLKGKTTFTFKDFRAALDGAGKGDFCYLDPPYLAEEGKDGTFAEYVGAFTEKDHKDIARLAREAADNGATVVVSNHDSTRVREIYGSADRFYALDVHRGMSDGQGKGDSTAREILAVWQTHGVAIGQFIRKPAVGEKPDPFGMWADPATLDRKVFKIAKANRWLETGATPDKISFRSFRDSGRALLTIARQGLPVTRQLALGRPGREKCLSLKLLTDLIGSDRKFPPDHLLPEAKASARLLDLAQRLEKALAGHPMKEKALTRILRSKAEIYVTLRPADQELPIRDLPERYRALLDIATARKWGFDTERCQRLLLYAELFHNSGTKNFISICGVLGKGLPLKVMRELLPSIKTNPGKGLAAGDYVVITHSKTKELREAIEAAAGIGAKAP
jgi:DNA adenine methylase